MDSEDGDHGDGVLTINKDFAKRYDRWRQKEELQKLKDKYGDVSEESSSSSETEDEDAEALTSQVEKDWFRAYAAVKSRDPKIYQRDSKFYHSPSGSTSSSEEEEQDTKARKRKKEKPVTIKDYERKVILEKGGVLSDDSEERDYEERNVADMGYFEEQDDIKKSFKAVLENSDGESDSSDLLQHREKSTVEKTKDEEDYREWLKGQKSDLGSEQQTRELEPLKQYWTDPTLEDGEKFLRDYILNKGYLDKDKDRIPTYEEIVADEDVDFSEEDDILKKQEDFEIKYNFRFEEPDPEFIKTYPRSISGSVRRKENKRAKKRQEVKDRKSLEKEKKREEIKQLKNLKKREIMDKIDRLKEITGNSSLGVSENDIEGDWDPDKYDKLMQKVFDDEYYGTETDQTKPVFPEDDDLHLEENWDQWQGEVGYEGEEGPHADDPNFIMDADYDPTAVVEKSEGKKKKKKSKFAQALTNPKPVFDPSEKSFEEYFEEYYKLDYEDIVGDLPCRFKYRKVIPNRYGLTTDEILSARDKELNAWCSVKKFCQYRPDQDEYAEIKKYRRKAKKKFNVLTSLREMHGESSRSGQFREEYGDDRGEGSTRRGGQNKRTETTRHLSADDVDSCDAPSGSGVWTVLKQNRTLEGEESIDESTEQEISDQPRKKKIKWKDHNTESSQTDKTSESNTSSFIDTSPKKKKRKGDKMVSSKQTDKTLERDKSSVTYSKKKKGNGERADSLTESEISSVSDNTSPKKKPKDEQFKESKLNSTINKSAINIKSAKTKKKHKAKAIISDERLKAYGIDPKKFKYRNKDKLKILQP